MDGWDNGKFDTRMKVLALLYCAVGAPGASTAPTLTHSCAYTPFSSRTSISIRLGTHLPLLLFSQRACVRACARTCNARAISVRRFPHRWRDLALTDISFCVIQRLRTEVSPRTPHWDPSSLGIHPACRYIQSMYV